MRTFIAVVAGLAGLLGSAMADAQVVRWGRVEGLGAADYSTIWVGPIQASRGRTVGDGRVMLNLETGFLSFTVTGLTNGNHYDNAPIGAPWYPGTAEQLIGTVMCDSTQRFAPATWVDTLNVAFDARGNGKFEGFVGLPQQCKDRPAELVFLLRHADRPGNKFVAYGAGRTIQ
jgi:hypothetical protein